jgi:ribosomal protein S19
MGVELIQLSTRELLEVKLLNISKYFIVSKEKGVNLHFKQAQVLKLNKLRLNYVSSSVLRSIYLISLNPIHHSSEKKIFSRGSCVPRLYSKCEVVIHKGNGYKLRHVNKYMVGFKFGEFTWNRKLAFKKEKQKKKKKNKV